MTKEELLELVNGKVDTTKLKSLSKKTISEELDDVLEDLGDDESENDKVITKLANRLKRIDGNLHKNVSDEIKKSREEIERKKKEEEVKPKPSEEEKTDEKYAALEAKINQLLEANAERDKKAARKATVESIKNGLKDKFEKANLAMNDFFLDTALSKLEIPDENVDIIDLVSKAESIYTADYKRANGGNAIPRKGQNSIVTGEHKINEHEWDDLRDAYKDRSAKATVKK